MNKVKSALQIAFVDNSRRIKMHEKLHNMRDVSYVSDQKTERIALRFCVHSDVSAALFLPQRDDQHRGSDDNDARGAGIEIGV